MSKKPLVVEQRMLDLISQRTVDEGNAYVEVYSMMNDEDGATLSPKSREPDFYDVMLRLGDNYDNFQEWEDLDLPQVESVLNLLDAHFPGIDITRVTA